MAKVFSELVFTPLDVSALCFMMRQLNGDSAGFFACIPEIRPGSQFAAKTVKFADRLPRIAGGEGPCGRFGLQGAGC